MIDHNFILSQMRFALSLLQQTAKPGMNVLIAPFSAAQALGMAANGAEGSTLQEIETVLGGSREFLANTFQKIRIAKTEVSNYYDGETAKLFTANSAWVRDRYPVLEVFLEKSRTDYDTEVFSAPFDQSTVNAINQWISEKAKHMIPSILHEISDVDMLYLLNTIMFDAQWCFPYDEDDIEADTFTENDGTKQIVKMMFGSGDSYLADEHAEGFSLLYQGFRYAFSALLPEEGMTPEEYLAGLTAERLYQTLSTPIHYKVDVISGLPQFRQEYSALLRKSLTSMGIKSAFDHSIADFSGITDSAEGLFLGDILQKTFLEVTPKGTRAGAVTCIVELPVALLTRHHQRRSS